MPINPSHAKKNALLAYKEKIIQDIKYYTKRIEVFQATAASNIYFEESYSSDSEDDFPATIENGPSVPQLKIQQSMLQTCLQATQELTSLQVLQSECNVMVEDPALEGQPPVKESGLWREVTAECRIDLVHFSIMFHQHQPSRKFAPISYRGLKVLPGKKAHEAELAKSILPGLTAPSEAVEVLRSYAIAYRSRRTTLAKLADKYAQNLFMEPMAEGGYVLKCANLLEVSWRLENKWSPVAAFHHRMKFDLEYMDESYIKIIAQAHKQLSDPSIETDERTLLLAKIISTCLEAQGPTQELYESMESDHESVKNLEKKRTTLDQDIEVPAAKKKKEVDDRNRDARTRETAKAAKDDEIMAPPKSLPKKVKPKGKENMDENRKSVKRSNVGEGSSIIKKAKTDSNANNNVRESESKQNEAQNKGKSDIRNKNKAKTVSGENIEAIPGTSQKNIEKEPAKDTEVVKNVKKTINKQNPTKKIVGEGSTKNQDTEILNDVQDNAETAKNIQDKNKKTSTEKVTNKAKNVASSKNDPKTKVTGNHKKGITKNSPDTDQNNTKTTANAKNGETQKLSQKIKPIQNDKPQTSKTGTKSTNDDQNTEETSKTLKKVAVTTKENEKLAKKVSENVKNVKSNEAANTNKHLNVKKDSNDLNTKKSLVNKESNSKTAKSSQDVSNKNRNTQKNRVNNKPQNQNAKTIAGSKNNEQNVEKQPTKNMDGQKSNAQNIKAIANPKNRDTINAKNVKEIIKVVTRNSPKPVNKVLIKENKHQQTTSKGNTIESVVKVNNVATKNKEHIADRTDANNAAITKKDPKTNDAGTKNAVNKMAIQNLSHKNLIAQNKLLRKSITGNTGKSGNTAKYLKASNIFKQNGSATKTTKIPLKSISESTLKRNPLRVSPRNMKLTFKSVSDTYLKQKTSQKLVTNIPRLMRKPEPKVK